MAVRKIELSPYAEYVRARAAAASGMPDVAAAHYRALLDIVPNDTALTARAFREAVVAGDRALMVQTAQMLDAQSALPPDGRLVLLSEAIANKDWKSAKTTVDRIEQEDAFGFLVPVLRAWIAFGAKDGDALAKLNAGKHSGPLVSYASEHRVLLLLATGQTQAAQDLLKAQADGGLHDPRTLLLAAQYLANHRDRTAALALLTGDAPAVEDLRQRITAKKPVSPGIEDAAGGIAELLLRVAIDINRQQVTAYSLSLARSALILTPNNAQNMLDTVQLLGVMEKPDAALTMLDKVRSDDPLADDARDLRIRLLLSAGRSDEALKAQLKVTGSGRAAIDDWSRLGDIYTNMDQSTQAAWAYSKALDLALKDPDAKDRLWSLYLLVGGALEQAGDWPAAKAALTKAVSLAGDQPVALNYLGFAQLEHRENLPEAQKLIERALALRPDDAAITDSLGWAYYLRGNLKDAIEKLETAAAGEPGESSINEHLGDAYWSAGRRLDARFAWRAALVQASKTDLERLNRKIDVGLQPSEISHQ